MKQISQATATKKSTKHNDTVAAASVVEAEVVPIGMELLATTEELPFKLFNSPGSGNSIDVASREVTDIYTGIDTRGSGFTRSKSQLWLGLVT